MAAHPSKPHSRSKANSPTLATFAERKAQSTHPLMHSRQGAKTQSKIAQSLPSFLPFCVFAPWREQSSHPPQVAEIRRLAPSAGELWAKFRPPWRFLAHSRLLSGRTLTNLKTFLPSFRPS